jgi:hypothetical protein
MTTGPTGLYISFEERLKNIFQRYDQGHIVNHAIHQAIPSLTHAVEQTPHLLSQLESQSRSLITSSVPNNTI